jgi:hypothetical protein
MLMRAVCALSTATALFVTGKENLLRFMGFLLRINKLDCSLFLYQIKPERLANDK